ncbi:MAG: ATP-binding protein, partial [Cycloclasticus sp.]
MNTAIETTEKRLNKEKGAGNVEWKASWSDKYLTWICGIANAEGGVLLIGRDEKGEDIGVRDARDLLDIIPNRIRTALGIVVEVNLLAVSDKELLEIVVKASAYPVSYNGQYHYRNSRQTLTAAELERTVLAPKRGHWDALPMPGFSLDDCHQKTLLSFKNKAVNGGRVGSYVLNESDASLLDNLQLSEGGFLKRAAALLFSDRPETFIPGAFIQLKFFSHDGNLHSQASIYGDLFSQLEQLTEVLKLKYLKIETPADGSSPREGYQLPLIALHEALLNALIHKDYSSEKPIEVSVHGQQMSIWNPACLPDSWGSDRLSAKQPSTPLNPLLANAFFRSGYVESWGRGIEKIQDECRKHHIPAPLFNNKVGLQLTLRSEAELLPTNEEKGGQNGTEVTTQQGPEVTTQQGPEVTTQQGPEVTT